MSKEDSGKIHEYPESLRQYWAKQEEYLLSGLKRVNEKLPENSSDCTNSDCTNSDPQCKTRKKYE